MHISGQTARYELSHLNLHCLQKPFIAFSSESVKRFLCLTGTVFLYMFMFERYGDLRRFFMFNRYRVLRRFLCLTGTVF